MKCPIRALAALAALSAVLAEDSVYMTIGFCPSDFTGKARGSPIAVKCPAASMLGSLASHFLPLSPSPQGAVVKVNATTGNFTIINRFPLPNAIIGCPMMESANYMADVVKRSGPKPFDGRNHHLSWTTEFGMLSVVDQDGGTITHNVNGKGGFAFDGFTSFAISKDAHTYHGLTPHVTQNGFCNDGCFQFGNQDIEGGVYSGFGPLPFKSIMSDTRFFHEEKGVYYTQGTWLFDRVNWRRVSCRFHVGSLTNFSSPPPHTQGSYPLTDKAACSKVQSDSCMFAINATTGEFLWSKKTPDFEVYKYEDALAYPNGVDKDGTVLAWVFGFQKTCGKDLNSFAFARVHLATATAKLIACIPKKDVVHYNPNMAGFSHDNTRFATGSGNPYTGSMQLLVFDTKTGKTILDSSLPTLPAALGVAKDAPFAALWAMSHMP